MSAEVQDTGSAQENPKCLGAACLKRQAGKCTHGAAKTARGAVEDSGEVSGKVTPVPRVERRSILRQLLMQEKAQSLVEFAIALPVLLLVVTGIAVFGIALDSYMMLTEATSVGARQLTVSRGQTLDPCQTFSGAVYAAAPLLKHSNMAFTLSLNGTAYPGTSCSGTSTSGAPANMILGTNATVTVTYPFSLNLYGIKLVPEGSLLTAQTTELMQ